jgi:hypothetical protein
MVREAMDREAMDQGYANCTYEKTCLRSARLQSRDAADTTDEHDGTPQACATLRTRHISHGVK